MADLEAQARLAATLAPQQQRAWRPDGQDRDHRVAAALLSRDVVTVPGDAVAAVAVEAQPSRTEPVAQLGEVVVAEGIAGLVEDSVGQRLVLAVELQQPRHVDHAVVHRTSLAPPGHPRDQAFVELVGPVEPAWEGVDPRT